MKKNILVIFFDSFMNKVFADKVESFDMNFFVSDSWPKRPSSTSRLSIANYQAISKLDGKYNIFYKTLASFEGDIDFSFLYDYDLIVINQVASLRSHYLVGEIVNYLIDNDVDVDVIFGTEVTWFSELKKETFTKRQLNFIYYDSMLLRHTAKSDTIIYNDFVRKPNVYEFELGIDTNLLVPNVDITERKYITFVTGPEGRVTKNNDLAFEIKNNIERDPRFESYFNNGVEIKVVSPPYSVVELWEIYKESIFLIFTSNSETFSYVLNDAKSFGVVTFYKYDLYSNVIGSKYCLNNYPGSGIVYDDVGGLLDNMIELLNDHQALRVESLKSRNYVISEFSLNKVSENWDKVFEGDYGYENIAYIYDDRYDDFSSCKDVIKHFNKLGCKYVIVVCDRKGFFDLSYFSLIKEGIIFVPFLYSHDGSYMYRSMKKSLARIDFTKDIVLKGVNNNEVSSYFYLFKRLYKIKKIYCGLEFYENNNFSSFLTPL